MSLENTPSTLYDSVCVPDLSDFLGNYNSQNAASQDLKPSPAPGTPAPAATYLHEERGRCSNERHSICDGRRRRIMQAQRALWLCPPAIIVRGITPTRRDVPALSGRHLTLTGTVLARALVMDALKQN
ncbi:hypothetical protein J6590_050111 [Homalodisca vitripennis]|nr:hypothetical protein J6590_050111 [Homalodisca vitripennis]